MATEMIVPRSITFLCTSVDNHTAIVHETCFAFECPGVSRLYVAERRNFLKIFITLAGDRMIIKKQRTKFVKKLQKAARGAEFFM